MKISIMNFKVSKYVIILMSIVFFTFIYFILDDTHFSGVNKVQETIRKNIVEEEIKPTLYKDTEGFRMENSIQDDIEKVNAMENAKIKSENVAEENELSPDQIEPTGLQQLFNRLYFSVSTGSLLGYGDVIPVSNISKLISIVQSGLTIMVIVM
uniref:Potassium channel domain-containing protein n=1 Tax=viral metagenome TaxID=1070528 RepID=A0A6C0JBK4_9ZZZZ